MTSHLLARQAHFCLSQVSTLFCSGYFWDRSHFLLSLSWTMILLLMLTTIDRCVPACSVFSVEMESWELYSSCFQEP
jgi:hypothetical protein